MKRQALRALMVLLALLFAPLTAFAQGAVQQSGPVVSGHAPLWFQNGVIGDAGTATNPLITTLGVHNPNPDFSASTTERTMLSPRTPFALASMMPEVSGRWTGVPLGPGRRGR